MQYFGHSFDHLSNPLLSKPPWSFSLCREPCPHPRTSACFINIKRFIISTPTFFSRAVQYSITLKTSIYLPLAWNQCTSGKMNGILWICSGPSPFQQSGSLLFWHAILSFKGKPISESALSRWFTECISLTYWSLGLLSLEDITLHYIRSITTSAVFHKNALVADICWDLDAGVHFCQSQQDELNCFSSYGLQLASSMAGGLSHSVLHCGKGSLPG